MTTFSLPFPMVVLAVIIAIVVAALLIWYAYRRGLEAGRIRFVRELERQRVAEPPIFGKGVSARSASRNLLDVMRSAIVLTDGLGNTRYVSPRAAQLHVVEDGHLVSDEIRDMLTQVVGDGVVRDREVELHVVPSSGRITDQKPMYLRVRIGRIATIDADALPALDSGDVSTTGGADELYAVFLEDVSERRNFERMRRDFVTNVSHELKTPAGAISLLAETVGDAADDPAAVKYFSGRISKESERLTELVKKLIELQKVQDDNSLTVTDTKPISVPRLVREAVAENEVQASAKHIELRMFFGDDAIGVAAQKDYPDADDGMPEAVSGSSDWSGADDSGESAVTADGSPLEGPIVNGDDDAIKTAVKNLVENAVRYSPEGTHVGVSVRQDDGKVQIRVVDQGIGIPAEAQNRIFERFYRVDPARSRATGGTGLGLSITKHIVQEAGGTISVWSHPGEGSTFTITLPAADAGQD